MTAPADAPVYGESTKRERTGWYFYDWANSAFSTTLVAVFLGPYLTAMAKQAAGCTEDTKDCLSATLPLFGLKAGSFYPTVITVAVILNVLILPVVGAIADRSPHKRRLLAIAAYIGAAATIGMFWVKDGNYLLGGLLTIIATMAFAASIVVYQSFLPQLCNEEDRDRVSSFGWAFGYLGGGLLLAANLAAVIMLEEKYGAGFIARASMASAGVWWALFTLLPLRWLRERPPVEGVAQGNIITDGFKQLGHTLKGIKAYPLTLFFLGAYLVYNDGIQTVINLSSTYATEELLLPQSTLIITVLLIQFLAFGGALSLGFLAGRFGAWKTVLLSLVLWIIIIIFAANLPEKAPVPFMVLGASIGLVLGGSQALSRSLFSQLIPKGKEAE
ncbi:MAG TPA: MFS transporter, partial [Micromonosporaceae bacterium]|nr:MFS transporter [Micromonosporaceae bacterium]